MLFIYFTPFFMLFITFVFLEMILIVFFQFVWYFPQVTFKEKHKKTIVNDFQHLLMWVYLNGWWCVSGFLSPLLFPGKWLYYPTSLSWLLLHIADIRLSLHFCPRQLWGCGDDVRHFSGALGLIGCVSYISDKYRHLREVAGNVSGLHPSLSCFV